MSNIKERGPSAYNTAYDEFPEDLSIFPPHLWLFLFEILLMIFLFIMLLTVIEDSYIKLSPEINFAGMILCTLSFSLPNALIAYGYNIGIKLLRFLCIFCITVALPSLLINSLISTFLVIIIGLLVYWITTTNKFELFFQHRLKLGFWRREQLEKNKIRREVIKERKQKTGRN